SLADVGYLGMYVCFLIAVTKLVGSEPRRRFDPELLIDTVLVTLMAGVLVYEFLLKPLFDLAGSVPSMLTSIAWSVGGVAVLWLILVELLPHTRVPLAAAGVVTALGVLCVTNVVYAASALRGSFHSGGALDLGWDAGLLLLASAAAVAPAAQLSAGGGSSNRMGPPTSWGRWSGRRKTATSSSSWRPTRRPWSGRNWPLRSAGRFNGSRFPSHATTKPPGSAPSCTPRSAREAGLP